MFSVRATLVVSSLGILTVASANCSLPPPPDGVSHVNDGGTVNGAPTSAGGTGSDHSGSSLGRPDYADAAALSGPGTGSGLADPSSLGNADGGGVSAIPPPSQGGSSTGVPGGCTSTNALVSLGPGLSGTATVVATMGTPLPSILTNGTLGTFCPLNEDPNTDPYSGVVSTTDVANSATISVQNMLQVKAVIGATITCPGDNSATAIAVYRRDTPPASMKDVEACTGEINSSSGTTCASLANSGRHKLKPCETITLLVQNLTNNQSPSVKVSWDPEGRQ